ncbi:hypothetical protein G7081_05675 [Vagococcus coleopterorum]|uniref:Helicase Helix-turn-helix domain-containing protein n=1 Tax=Vagococcus coleopterorum TaxID=2714946 RepID=A0A6G8ANE4_9ENTE|nr:helix-turn-helix domain-containing protein [Vagococcus coleopterorum]QIL46601.1 hypothetical protein G7081_05675 [Vagococcus coleopterorum]
MNELNTYILSLFTAGDKLRVTSLFQLLKGKRTSSVLMFGYLNGLLKHFGLFPKLTTKQYQAAVNALVSKDYLMLITDNVAVITAAGSRLKTEKEFEVTALNGVTFCNTAQEFFDQLLFTTQVISELSYHEKEYLPVELNSFKQHRTKLWLQTKIVNYPEINRQLYQEWVELLPGLPEGTIALLTGHNQIGKTYNQVRKDLSNRPLKQYLAKTNLMHQMITTILMAKQSFPLFVSLFKLTHDSSGNHSASESYRMYEKGLSVTEIMLRRQLKRSTVVDHIIEGLILSDTLPSFELIPKQEREKLDAYRSLNSDFKVWRYGDVIETEPIVSFLSFRIYQIELLREEK